MTTTTPSPTPPTTTSRRRTDGGPPLVLLATIYAALFLGGLVSNSVLTGQAFPSPFLGPEVAPAYFAGHATAVAVGAFLQFGAAVPLAIYAATASARLRNLGIHNPGATIAQVGGVLAAASLSLSAMVSWTLTRPAVISDPALVHALNDLVFMAGGPGQIVPQGLLLAGISVPALFARLLPRWLAVTGLVLALVAELSSLSLIIEGAVYLLPVARFLGFAWLIVAGAMLVKRRAARTA